MAAVSHFGWPKITFDRICRHFRSIRIFVFVWIFFMTENHFRSHFSPFQIKMAAGGHFGSPICAENNRVLPLYVLSMAMPNMKLIGEFMTELEKPQAFWAFLYKMAARGHFDFPIDAKNHRVPGFTNLTNFTISVKIKFAHIASILIHLESTCFMHLETIVEQFVYHRAGHQ